MKRNSTVLIVDDEPVGRQTLEALLIGQGYTLVFATSGGEALAKAAEVAPDVILLDVMMPDLDGFKVCRLLRTNPLLAEVPVIMVTALDDHDSCLHGIEAGADDFVSKPFNRAELRARVRNITQLNRYRQLLLERAKFEWVVEQADDGYLVINDRDAVSYANPQARRYLNLSADEQVSISETFLALVSKWYRREPQETWATWPQQPAGGSLRYLVQPESPTANAFWLQADVMKMTSGSAESYLVRLRDVTAGVVAQRAMWTFHAQISHKLRTPIGLVTGYLDVLREDRSALSETEQQAFLSTAHKKAMQLQDEIRDILRYLEVANLVKSGHGRCAVAEIQALTAEISASLELRSIHISYDGIENHGDAHMPISRQTMMLVLQELLENAKKFHPEQSPTLEIHVSRVSGGIRIQVRDDGLTLSSGQLAKIWTAYYQAENSHSGQVPGMGLGLSMVASLIWELGGTCRAFNREGGPGLVVELVLPIRDFHSPDEIIIDLPDLRLHVPHAQSFDLGFELRR